MFQTDNIQELLLYLIDNNSIVTFKYKNQEVVNKKFIGIYENNIIIEHSYGLKRIVTRNVFLNLEKELIPTINQYKLVFSYTLFPRIDSTVHLLAKENNNYIIFNYETDLKQTFTLEEILKYNFETNYIFYGYLIHIPIQN
jgi:hypothetical protein